MMSNKLKSQIDALAGEYKWYLAGGAAAYWHIAHYVDTGPTHLHDFDYWESTWESIFPGDVEGNALDKKVDFILEGKLGPMQVTLQQADAKTFDVTTCDRVDGIYVLNRQRIIDLYARAGGKVEKRNRRIAMLKIIEGGVGITGANVMQYTPEARPNLGNQIKLGFKLKEVEKL